MFKKLVNAITGNNKTELDFDPQVFEDPIALKTEWCPAKKGGANFCTHRLQTIDPHRQAFKPTLGVKLFFLAFALLASGLVIFSLYSLISGNVGEDRANVFVPLLMAVIFGIASIVLYHTLVKEKVFDKTAGWYWKGKQPDQNFDGTLEVSNPCKRRAVKLEEIHALQILSEYVSGSSNSSSYHSYELNLVLHDGSRINVLDHGQYSALAEDAYMLSEFLGVPVWDAEYPPGCEEDDDEYYDEDEEEYYGEQ